MTKIFTTITLLHTLLFASFTGYVLDHKSSKPIVGAYISDSGHSVKSDINGWFHFGTDENYFYIKSKGYETLKVTKKELRRNYKLKKRKLQEKHPYQVSVPSPVSPPKVFSSSSAERIVDAKTLLPIKGAMINDSSHMVKSDTNGEFSFHTNEDRFFIKAYGYKALEVKKDSDFQQYKMEPIKVKALYLTFWAASGNSDRMKKVFKIIEKSEANAVVVDIKNEYGSTLFLTSFDEANSYGAHEARTNRNIQRFMKMLKDRNIYSIARIVTFKDELQASNNPDYAIKNQKGEIWRNHDNMAWVDPYDKRSHEYAIRMAEEAAKVGFDEINFDYIRFPAKTDLVFTREDNTEENRIKAINTFLDSAKQRLLKYGVYISVDTYGNISTLR